MQVWKICNHISVLHILVFYILSQLSCYYFSKGTCSHLRLVTFNFTLTMVDNSMYLSLVTFKVFSGHGGWFKGLYQSVLPFETINFQKFLQPCTVGRSMWKALMAEKCHDILVHFVMIFLILSYLPWEIQWSPCIKTLRYSEKLTSAVHSY